MAFESTKDECLSFELTEPNLVASSVETAAKVEKEVMTSSEAGRCYPRSLLSFTDASIIALKIENEVLSMEQKLSATEVASVANINPSHEKDFLPQSVVLTGLVQVRNFAIVGFFAGYFRQNHIQTRMKNGLEVEMIGEAFKIGGLTTIFAIEQDKALQLGELKRNRPMEVTLLLSGKGLS